MRNVSSNFQSAVNNQTTNEVFTVLLTISHNSFDDDIRICSDPAVVLPIAGVRGVVSNSVEYIYLPFEITFPSDDGTGISRATLSVDNIDRQIIAAVRGADSSINITIQIVLSSDPDTVECIFENYKLLNAKYDVYSVSAEISQDYFDLEPFPSNRFVPSQFPGMF